MPEIKRYKTEFHSQKVCKGKEILYIGGFDTDGNRGEIRGENATKFYAGLISRINDKEFFDKPLLINPIFELMQVPKDDPPGRGYIAYPLVELFSESQGYDRKELDEFEQKVVKGILNLHNQKIDIKDFIAKI